MKTILLKFSGPLQSWGTNARFEDRFTDRYPSKSALIGLISASFGYRRNEKELITRLNKLDFAVRVDQPGNILSDYQIAAKYKSNGTLDRTYVTNRYYLQDAVFLVAISSENHELIEEIIVALKNPYFQPFLGRRSVPLNPDFYIGVKNKNIIECLIDESWHASKWYRKKHKTANLEIYADSHLLEGSVSFMKRDLSVSFSQKGRLHSFRAVSRIMIKKDDESVREHDAFNSIGGEDVFI